MLCFWQFLACLPLFAFTTINFSGLSSPCGNLKLNSEDKSYVVPLPPQENQPNPDSDEVSDISETFLSRVKQSIYQFDSEENP